MLAAGGSSRLGRPKQLVRRGNKTLLQNTLDSAFNAGVDDVIVVLGANKDLISNSIKEYPVQTVINENWATGLSSSIKKGIEAFENRDTQPGAILIMLSDQPHVSKTLVSELINWHQYSSKEIIASQYKGIIGVPAIFPVIYFKELKMLSGDKGARKLLMKQAQNVKTVTFAKGHIDIDTPADLENYLKNKNTE
ncbi:MAG: nucleotidyltransferase family protein [Bacteroidota bacterium]